MARFIQFDVGVEEVVRRFRRLSEGDVGATVADGPRVSRTGDGRVFRIQFSPNDRAMLARPCVRARVLRRRGGAGVSLEPEMNPRGLALAAIGVLTLAAVTLAARHLPGGDQIGWGTVLLPGTGLFLVLLVALGVLGRAEVERAEVWLAVQLARELPNSPLDQQPAVDSRESQ